MAARKHARSSLAYGGLRLALLTADVLLDMALHITFLNEGLAAALAHVGHVVEVNPYVVVQSANFDKALRAIVADQLLLGSVGAGIFYELLRIVILKLSRSLACEALLKGLFYRGQLFVVHLSDFLVRQELVTLVVY